MHRRRILPLAFGLLFAIWPAGLHAAADDSQAWVQQVLQIPYAEAAVASGPTLQLLRQDFEDLEVRRSVLKTTLAIGSKRFQRGLGTHSVSHLRIHMPQPIARLSASIGVDRNERTQGGSGSVVFSVSAGARELFRSEAFRGGQEPRQINIDVRGAKILDLQVGDGGDGPACDHADWADAQLVMQDGKTIWLDELKRETPRVMLSRYPFLFVYDGRHSDQLLPSWQRQERTERLDDGRRRSVTTWTDPQTKLRIEWQATRFADYPAAEWLLWFENIGSTDTPILENVQAMDLTLPSAAEAEPGFRLHRTNGAPSNPTDFEPCVVSITKAGEQVLSAAGGRSSNGDFPFFKIETPQESYIVAVGWSGQWRARLQRVDGRHLHVTAGLEKTRFRLRAGERVRSPRMLVLRWPGDTLESNAQFRQLVYKHYAARHNGERRLPTLFCNTCFTRGGGWLNECNAENQISLIRAYARLGLEALWTDAGWFEGGWPAGAGNWTPRKDAYPQGMGPVAAAARAHGMIYGVWYEFERVVAGTQIHREHPEWLLRSTDGPEGQYLLNLGLPEVREHLFQIVKGFMDLPGFRVYRQDFNMDPLPYWLHSDAPDRQGITEMKYIEGLYAYWDRIAQTWPDSLREECASGGRRIDLETVMRMHIHQKSDYWFDNDVDQASLWGLSQYLPNSLLMAPVNRLDDYSFHSAMATSLCLGWIADTADFDLKRATQLADRYRRVRHLLVGAWYPLLPYSRDPRHWMAVQYHRPDLDEGMVLLFRRAESPYPTAELRLHGLDPAALYEITHESTGQKVQAHGAELMAKWQPAIAEQKRSELVLYRKAE